MEGTRTTVALGSMAAIEPAQSVDARHRQVADRQERRQLANRACRGDPVVDRGTAEESHIGANVALFAPANCRRAAVRDRSSAVRFSGAS